jgi:hypothetical protein
MADNDLRLNSLARYSKQSSEYVLEVHSHCEVPAGCGGVVLRWRNPRQAIPLEIRAYTAGEATFLLDGAPPATARPLVPYGEHVLAWSITNFDPAAPVLACAATYDETRPGAARVTPSTGQFVSILSTPDGTWRYTFATPPEHWTQPTFDDGAWSPMVAWAISDEERRKTYWLHHVCTLGAEPLGVEGVGHTVWIRKRFSLTDEATDAAARTRGGAR